MGSDQRAGWWHLSAKRLVIATATVAAMAATAAAQGPTVPPSVQPGRIPQQFQRPEVPHAAPEITAPSAPENVAPPGAETVEVTLDSIVIKGATVYSPADFAPLVARYLHHPIRVSELYELANAISAKYRADGYILSRAVVPAQSIRHTATIVAIEGFVSDVHIEGYDSALLEAYGGKIRDSHPLRAAVLERYLLLANDLPGVSARAVLAASKTVEGGASLTIIATQKLTDEQFAVDNRGTKYIGPFQIYAGGTVNVPGTDEQIALRYITTPSARELQYGEASFTQPIGANGLRLVLYANYSHAQPQYTLSQFNEVSQGESASATLKYPIIRSREQNLVISGGFTVDDLYTSVNDDPSVAPSSDDHLRIFRAGADYDMADAWGGVNFVSVEISRGIPVFGASANSMRATPSRPGAKSDFGKVTGQISRLQGLRLIASGLALYGAVEAQHSDTGPLPASEQFGLGGPLWGRAYDPSDVVGDEGWAAKVELRYTTTPSGIFARWIRNYQLYCFYDEGRVSRNVATVGPPFLSSAGFGIRLATFEHLSADLEFAKPLTRDESIALFQPHARPWRFFMQVIGRY